MRAASIKSPSPRENKPARIEGMLQEYELRGQGFVLVRERSMDSNRAARARGQGLVGLWRSRLRVHEVVLCDDPALLVAWRESGGGLGSDRTGRLFRKVQSHCKRT